MSKTYRNTGPWVGVRPSLGWLGHSWWCCGKTFHYLIFFSLCSTYCLWCTNCLWYHLCCCSNLIFNHIAKSNFISHSRSQMTFHVQILMSSSLPTFFIKLSKEPLKIIWYMGRGVFCNHTWAQTGGCHFRWHWQTVSNLHLRIFIISIVSC